MISLPILSHRPTYCLKIWRGNPVLRPSFFPAKRSKNYFANLALETKNFSPGGTTSLLLLKPRHNKLFCTPITDQYNSPRIYCLFYTHILQVLIRTEMNGCFSRQILQQNVSWILSQRKKMFIRRAFIL